jgi:hypothetical protein
MSAPSYLGGIAVLGIVSGVAGSFSLACSSSAPDASGSDSGAPGNHALKFNGTTDYAQAGNATFVSSSSPQTVSLWVQLSMTDAGAANPQAFISLQRDNQSGLLIGIKGGELAAWRQYETAKDPPLASSAIPAAGWHHVAYVLEYDPEHQAYLNTLYLDGNAVGTSMIMPNNLTPSLVFLGCSDQYTDFFAGSVDEIRIWKVARTAAEIQEEMRGEVHAVEPDLVAYFNCNEILDGGLLPDNSGSGNYAVLGGGDPKDMPTLVPSDRPQPR